jgi:hypothetical protein
MSVIVPSYPIRFSDPHERHQTVIYLSNYAAVARRRGRFRRLCITGRLQQRVAPFCRWVPYAHSVDSGTTSFVCQLAPYKLERRTKNGKVLYTYADKQKGIVYIGGETEYQQYKRLAVQQSPQYNYVEDPADDDGTITQSQLKAVEIRETASLNWGPDWGPWQIWW